MFPVANPEVLSNDWLPPVPIAREGEVLEVVRRLDPPAPVAPPPWIVAVEGGPGSGTSTVARRAGREVIERLRRTSGGGGARLLHLRVAGARGPHGVASSLLRLLDDGFDGRGFPVPEILAGLLRRLRRAQEPFVVVLDDVGVGAPDLGPILRALVEPDRFLPEGEHGLPPWWTVVAGTRDGLERLSRGLPSGIELRPFVELQGYPPAVLEAIVRDRAARALGRPPPPALVARTVATALEDGGGSRRAIDVLRRELLGGGRAHGPGFLPRDGNTAIRIEPWVVDAIGRASHGPPPRLGDVRRWEAELARRQGVEPLPTTTLWRRIVRLEQAGYLRREIRTGGSGGTRSVVRLLMPIDEWVTAPCLPQSRRDGGRPSEAAASTASAARAGGWPPVLAG